MSAANVDPTFVYTPSNAEAAAPTMQLRWRWVTKPTGDDAVQRVRVLEQAWRGLTTGTLHWQEVPEVQ